MTTLGTLYREVAKAQDRINEHQALRPGHQDPEVLRKWAIDHDRLVMARDLLRHQLNGTWRPCAIPTEARG